MAPGKMVYTIVLADDHVLIRHGIKRIISQDSNLAVIGEVSNGEELLRTLAATLPDLLILDISMPKSNGIDLAEQLKQTYPTMKILMLTMHKTKQFFYRSMSAGADGYLIKSDSEKELLVAISKIRAGRIYVSPQLAEDFADDLASVCRRQVDNPLRDLTKREKQILTLVVEGYTSKAVAAKLNLSPRTVDHHRSNLLKKFNMKNSVDLVNYAVRNGYVNLD